MVQFPFYEIAQMSLHSLSSHKLRSLLALLGIVIGIAALIITMSLGKGTQKQIEAQILSLGRNFIIVESGAFSPEGKVIEQKGKLQIPLNQSDYEAIRQQVSNIKYISPVIESKKSVSYGGMNIYGYVKGGTSDLGEILGRTLAKGTFFSPYQEKIGARVAVLGSRAAAELFGEIDPIDKLILIDKTPFKVIGVLKEIPNYQAVIQDENLEILVPLSTVWRRLIRTWDNSFSMIIIQVNDPEKSPNTASEIRNILRYKHRLRERYPDDFKVFDQKALSDAANKSTQTLNLFLIFAAGISMLVGGIGIMNIMLVSMAERTKEIGIRMAIGASPNMILMQFLLEAVVLCLIGGIIGIVVGLLTPEIVTYLTGLISERNWASVWIALLMSVATGVFFGFHPAYKASQLNPVQALRSK